MSTTREAIVEVMEMSRDVMLRDPLFKSLFERLKEKGLDELVWKVYGGVPSRMKRLAVLPNDDRFVEMVHQELMQSIVSCVGEVDKSSSQYRDELLPLFRSTDLVSKEVVNNLKIVLPSPDKVCRINTWKEGVEPASPTMGFVLRHGLYVQGGIRVIEDLEGLKSLAKERI